MATEAAQNNIAFTCQMALGNISACVDILTSTGRYAEAVLLSKTYKPSLTAGLVQRWKSDLMKSGKERIAKSIASPDGNLDLFPGWTDALEKEHASLSGSLVEGSSVSGCWLIVVEDKVGGMSLNEHKNESVTVGAPEGVSTVSDGINGTGKLKD